MIIKEFRVTLPMTVEEYQVKVFGITPFQKLLVSLKWSREEIICNFAQWLPDCKFSLHKSLFGDFRRAL
jgi:hypothetical protein